MRSITSPKDEKYFKDIYNDYKPLVVFIAALYLDNKDDIDDVIQDVFLETFSHIGEIDNLKSYISTLAKNKAITRNKSSAVLSTLESMDAFLFANLQTKDVFVPMIEEIGNVLGTSDANIVLLHLYGGYSFKDISEKMNINEKTAKTKYYRALKKCKKELL